MSLGIGLGAFMQGMGQGINTGRTLVDMQDRAETRNTMRDGAATARTARDGEIATRVAGGATQEDAEREVGSFVDYYMRTGAPRVVENLISSGQPERAQAFQTWIRAEGTQRGMRSWGAAIRAAQAGDGDGFARNVISAYNNDEYSPDGQTVSRHQVLRDDAGNLTGMELTIRGRDGRERTERFNGTTDLYRRAIGFLSPEQQFQHITGELTAARAATTQAALHNRNRQAGNEDFVYRAGVTESIGQQREARTELRTDRRRAEDRDNQIERDNNQSWLRQVERLATQRGETVAQIQPRLEAIRRELALNDARITPEGPKFSALTQEQQMAHVESIFLRQRSAAEGIAQPRGAQGAPAGATVPVYRPPAPGQGLPPR